MQILSELKLKILIGFFFALGLIVRKLFPDPLADFFAEMEQSGRLKIRDDPKAPIEP
jgi:hypothetical protein